MPRKCVPFKENPLPQVRFGGSGLDVRAGRSQRLSGNSCRQWLAQSSPSAYAPRMDQTKTALERAFELAKSGRFTRVSDVKKAISDEGYSAAQVQGRMLTRQLGDLIRAAKEKEA